MPPFDYNAPAELFLAKPMKGSRTKYRRFATGCRSGTTASTVLKSAPARSFCDVACNAKALRS